MTTSWNGYGGNFGGLNLCCIGPKAQTCDMSHHNRFRVFESEDIDNASDDAHIDSTTKPGDNCDKGTLAGNVERKVMPRKYTIGDAIQIAKTRVAKKQRSSRAEGQRILDELVADKTDDPLVVLACLLPQSTYTQADAGPSLCTNIHDEYEKIEMMIDSGASETVVSQKNSHHIHWWRPLHQELRIRLQRKRMLSRSSTLVRSMFKWWTLVATKAGPNFRCAKDSDKTGFWGASADWLKQAIQWCSGVRSWAATFRTSRMATGRT